MHSITKFLLVLLVAAKSSRAIRGFSSLALVILFTTTHSIATPLPERANILLIVADDLGYSDLGIFGGEINTPNLDSLAREGVALRRFHAAPNCGPSRASTLTGVDFHRAGMGGNAEVVAENQKTIWMMTRLSSLTWRLLLRTILYTPPTQA